MEALIHLHILASGSKGNATVVEGPDGMVLLDCGISRKQVFLRAEELGLDLGRVRAVFITHEHSDHVSGLPVFAKTFGGKIYATEGTACERSSLESVAFTHIGHDDELCVAGMRVRTFPTSHDVADPFGLHFLVQDGRGEVLDSVGWCTDTGYLTERAFEELRGCRLLGLESNHDVRMLAEGPYPAALKARVKGERGHLSNDQCAESLGRLVTGQTSTVIALHISEKNNLPSIAKAAISQVVPSRVTVLAAGQNRPMTVW